MDVLEQPSDDAPIDENTKVVQVMAPYQFGAMKPVQISAGANCPVVILIAQGGWAAQANFSQNDALDFARLIRQAVKDARSGLAVARSALVGVNGETLAVANDEDDELDSAVGE